MKITPAKRDYCVWCKKETTRGPTGMCTNENKHPKFPSYSSRKPAGMPRTRWKNKRRLLRTKHLEEQIKKEKK